eukprot:CAMPEP_0182557000 /NCGR_PEP_ID=MMETSP1324-20130603/1083_1 /TAXON_ID=236786 /ORGANISM="Florenciella sp., Strain RCC1587" /LENGTH=46 /DNA_ID= /DNA_START= /DNA_END= /DNA_ORIENTATION=
MTTMTTTMTTMTTKFDTSSAGAGVTSEIHTHLTTTFSTAERGEAAF